MVISLAGEWDIYRREELRERLAPALSDPDVILDLTSAKYITSTLICALVLVHKDRVQKSLGPISLAVTSAFVRRLCTATGLDGLFPIYPSVDAALRSRRISA